MTPNVTVVIPVHRDEADSQWTREAIASFPEGTPYLLAVNDGEYAEAVNEAVEQAETKWVLVFSNDNLAAPRMLENLLEMAFAADVVYQGVMGVDPQTRNEEWAEPVPPFCPNRLLEDNYVPAAALVLRDSFLQTGGYRAQAAPLEAWDLYVRGLRAGWRFKPCQVTFYGKRLVENGRTSDYDVDATRAVIVGEKPEPKATFYYQATHACAYLRCVLPARYLPGIAQGDLYATIKAKPGVEVVETGDDLEEILFPFHRGKAAVLQFAGDRSWAVLQHHLQETGIRTLIEVDDNYLIDPGGKIRAKSNWGRRIGEAVHTYEGHRYIVKWADGVIVTTEQLASAYSKFNDGVYVIPNPVDPVDWAHVRRPDDDVFRIGWFASTSHVADIHLVTRALEWAARQPGVEVLTLGIDPKWRFPCTSLPWVNDLDAYRLLMGMLDVGVCPVMPDHFSVFRSDVKASELTMGGAAVIASDVPPYSHWQHDEFCLKARTAKDFFHHVKRLVGNREEARQLAAEARAWVDENRNIHRLLPLWEEALQVSAPMAVAA